MIHSKRIKQYCNMFSSNLHCTATDSVQSCVRNRRCGLSTLLGSWYCWFGAGVWRAPEKFLRIKKWNRRIKYLILSESGSKHICGDPPKSRRNYAKAEVANQRPCPTNSCLTSSFHVHVLDEVSNSGVFVPVTVIFCSSQWQMMKSNASRAQVSSWIYRQKSLCKRAGFFLAQKCWWLASQNHLKYVTLVDSLARVLENKPAHWKPFWQRFLSLLDKRRLFSAVNSQSVVWLYLTVGPLCFIASLLVPLMIFGFFLLGGKLQQATKLHKGITKLQNPCYAHRRWMGTLRIRLSGSTNWNQQGLKICSIFCDSGAEKNMEIAAKICCVVFFQWKMDVDELIIVFTREFDQNEWIHNTWSPLAFSVAHQLCIGKEWLQSVRRHSTLPPFAASVPKKEKSGADLSELEMAQHLCLVVINAVEHCWQIFSLWCHLGTCHGRFILLVFDLVRVRLPWCCRRDRVDRHRFEDR